MSQEIKNNNISLNNLRECRFYLKHLENINGILNKNIDFTSVMEMNFHINTTMNYIFKEKIEDKSILLKDIAMKYKKESIMESDFGSLLTDDRANYFTWLSLKSNIKDGYITTEYNYPEINFQPSSTKDRTNCILSIIDAWPAKREIKLSMIDKIKSDFSLISNEFKHPFKWLDKKNIKQCEFAYEYTINFFKENPYHRSNALDYITPISAHEKYERIIAIFDFWRPLIEAKKLFLININKAWNQQKFREKVKNKKQALNTYINKDAKKCLDELTGRYNKKINEMIEFLIYKELESLNNNDNEKNSSNLP